VSRFGDSGPLYLALFISLALNLFFLPGIAGRWFWNTRAERLSVADLHPAEVKTVTLKTPKTVPPPPKPKPIPVKPLKSVPRHSQVSAKPRTKTTTASTPHPHVLAQDGSGSSGPPVSQGTGDAGLPTVPTPDLPPPPPPPPPPRPKGETREAVALTSPVPQIPDSLRSESLKTFIRARFDIAADGTAQVTLLTSSGSAELDQLTLQTLRQWRWKPALQNGVSVPSIERLRIEYEVQ